MNNNKHQKSRRDFLKTMGYVAPVILTMKAVPALAGSGSRCMRGNNGIGQEKRGYFDGPPPGLASKPHGDFNDNGHFAPFGTSGAKHGGRPH